MTNTTFTKNFGIELELIGLTQTAAAEVLRNAGINAQAEGYNHNDHTDDMWKVVTDASVRGEGGACEVVSPILHGAEGLEVAKRVAKALENAGANANRTCGLHVHFDASQLANNHIKSIYTRYANFETEIDKFMPASRRADNNTYCHTVRNVASSRSFLNANTHREMINAAETRYRKINLHSLLRHNTIEFRQHSGTVEADKIENWVLFLSQFIDASVEACNTTITLGDQLDLKPYSLKILNIIKGYEDGASVEQLMEQGLALNTIRTQVSRIRKAGANIITFKRDGHTCYRVEYTASATNTEDKLFNGVSDEVVRFYRTRAAKFHNQLAA